ncbi:MBL fold metallo-hydrolase [Candidatus Berkelbacteria bacterium]|nr:MBL fold metallo-hydrolase [Candidatus Berkelbacteria bacterium]
MPLTNLSLGYQRRAKLFLTGAVLLLGLLFQLLDRPEAVSGGLSVTVLDVGQGDAILLTTPHQQHVLVDGGPDAAILGQLNHFLSPPNKFDLVVASHNHADHLTGLIEVLKRYPVATVWVSGAIHTSLTFENFIRAAGRAEHRDYVKAGDSITIDDTTFTVLYPLADQSGQEPANQHSATIVLRVQYGATSLLMTGDLEAEDEQIILDRTDQALLRSQVLKVTHHGSGHASSDDFLTAVAPTIGLISVGHDNKFGHPHQATLDRLTAHGIEIYRTDAQGAITCRSNGIVFSCRAERRSSS